MLTRTTRRLSLATALLVVGALVIIGLDAKAGAPGAVAESPAPEAAAPTLEDLAFLSGSWEAEFHGAHLEEQISAPRAGTMVAVFRWMVDGATTMTEHITFEQRADGVHLFLRHFNPGNEPWESELDGPMHFRLREVADGRAVFEDSGRAFPRHVIYHRTQPDALQVRLEGTRDDGTPREMEFNFRSTSMTTSTDTLTDAGQAMGYIGGLTISMQCSDISKSLDWYQNVVGFKLAYHMEEMGWCEMTTPIAGVMVGLSQVESPKVGGTVPTWGVKDIAHARQRLESQGVRFDGETMEIPGMVKLATFFDPDGNALMLFEMLGEMP